MQDFATTPFSEKGLEVDTPLPPVEEQGLLPMLVSVPTTPTAEVVPVAADGIADEFVGFWSLYPRRVGKKAAERAFRTARKAASVEEIAAGLHAQLPDLRRRETRYVPHPATWLNQQRWADDPGHAASPASGRNYDLEALQDRAAGIAPAPVTDPHAAAALAYLRGGAL